MISGWKRVGILLELRVFQISLLWSGERKYDYSKIAPQTSVTVIIIILIINRQFLMCRNMETITRDQ